MTTQEYRAKNPEKYRSTAKAYREANREKHRAWSAAWVAANPERVRVSVLASKKANPERVRATEAKWKKDQVEKMSDAYVKIALRMPAYQITPRLIEMKREQLLMHRALRELNKILKEQNGN